MACLASVACYGSKVEDVSSLFKRADLSVNNSLSPLLDMREKPSFDPFRLGLIIDGAKYRQTYAIRSSDVGPNKIATMESILNLFQETKVNQVRLIGLLNSDGFATTHEMMKNNLIWVLTRMQVEVDHYPLWGDIVDIDTWFVESKGLGVRREWNVQCHKTGLVFARGTSNWVMINQKTRKLARISKAVKDELSPWFVNMQVINHMNEKIQKLGADDVIYASNIKPKRSDLDMNNHVNNVKFLRWMLETTPNQFLETHTLCSAVLEYKKECKISDSVESLIGLQEDGIISNKDGQYLTFIHLLHTNGENKSEEIVRGKTSWKRN